MTPLETLAQQTCKETRQDLDNKEITLDDLYLTIAHATTIIEWVTDHARESPSHATILLKIKEAEKLAFQTYHNPKQRYPL